MTITKVKLLNENWYSLRRYYVDTFFLDNINIFKAKSHILDIGGKKKNKRGVFDIEIYDLNVKYANLDASTEPDYLCDIHKLPIESNTFDGVVLAEVLEHVSDPKQVLKEAYRVMKTGGKLMITTPFMFHIHADPTDYARYTPQWYTETLESLGFKQIQVMRHGLFFSVLSNMLKMLVYELKENPTTRNKLSVKALERFTYWFVKKSLTWDEKKFVKENLKLSGSTTGLGVICTK